VAIYSTFFLCKPEELSSGFPGWRPPLAEPVGREITNPFTGKTVTIETRAPEWPDDVDAEQFADTEFAVVAMQGNYEDYLENRLRQFVRTRPHWCAKGLTSVELDALAEAANLPTALEDALFSPPATGAVLQRIPPALLKKLLELDDVGLEKIGTCWASLMSAREHTHSATGVKLNDGWMIGDAHEILQPVVALARQGDGEHGLYLLIEA
jgi:hypothetical protein